MWGSANLSGYAYCQTYELISQQTSRTKAGTQKGKLSLNRWWLEY